MSRMTCCTLGQRGSRLSSRPTNVVSAMMTESCWEGIRDKGIRVSGHVVRCPCVCLWQQRGPTAVQVAPQWTANFVEEEGLIQYVTCTQVMLFSPGRG